MDKQYLRDKIEGLRHKFVESTQHERAVGMLDEAHMSKKMLKIKKKMISLEMSHDFLAQVITQEDIVVDATMGNGHDTLFLAKLAKQVYAFDIQEQALEKTSQRLQEAGLTNAELILQGHETVDQFVREAKAGIFNLGYLPSADKSIITQPQTTIEALEKLCHLLVKGGRIAIMIYYGHEGGDIEKDVVMDFVSQLPQQEYTATIYRTLNQINNPPFLVMIEKLERYRHG